MVSNAVGDSIPFIVTELFPSPPKESARYEVVSIRSTKSAPVGMSPVSNLLFRVFIGTIAIIIDYIIK